MSAFPASTPAPPVADAPPGRRERRKAETRRRLLDAARELFIERGYHETRPQDVARAADVAIGTFYVHFADKRAAFLAFTEEAARELVEHVRARTAEHADAAAGLEARLRSDLEALLEFSDANPGVLRAAFADEGVIAAGALPGRSLRDRLAEGIAVGLRSAIATGGVHADYDPPLLAYALVGLFQQALAFGAQSGMDRGVLLDQLTRFCGRGLVPAAARARRSSP